MKQGWNPLDQDFNITKFELTQNTKSKRWNRADTTLDINLTSPIRQDLRESFFVCGLIIRIHMNMDQGQKLSIPLDHRQLASILDRPYRTIGIPRTGHLPTLMRIRTDTTVWSQHDFSVIYSSPWCSWVWHNMVSISDKEKNCTKLHWWRNSSDRPSVQRGRRCCKIRILRSRHSSNVCCELPEYRNNEES